MAEVALSRVARVDARDLVGLAQVLAFQQWGVLKLDDEMYMLLRVSL